MNIKIIMVLGIRIFMAFKDMQGLYLVYCSSAWYVKVFYWR
jgi:hypothetical protein